MTAERLKHLALAVALDPSHASRADFRGWFRFKVNGRSPPKSVSRSKATRPIRRWSENISHAVREPPSKANAQLKLAAWCAEKGLKEQAIAHYTEVTRLDPTRETAWRHLGYKKHGNHWVKPEDLAAQRLEVEHQKHADLRWKPRLEKLREGLESRHADRRDNARTGLDEVTDPRAVPMIWKVFVHGNEAMQLVAVKLLGQIEGPIASNALATLAVFNDSAAGAAAST